MENLGVFVIFLILIGCIFAFVGIFTDEPETIVIGLLALIFATLLVVVCARFKAIENKNQISEQQKQIDNMIANGAEVYLNGNPVDITKIDTQYYYITIKDDYILLTPRN